MEEKCICKDISELELVKSGAFKDGYYPATNKDQIVHDEEGYYIWSDGGGDPFMAGCMSAFGAIKFCPCCGRELGK